MINIILMGLTSLLADFSSEMVFPILPFFIETLGGAGLAVGLSFGIGDAVAAVFKVISGRWADKTRKYKRFVIAGYAFSALAKFLYPISNTWRQILAVRPVERIGKGFRDAPRDAILSESLPHEQRGRAFGIQRAMDSAGAILGSLAVLLFVVYWDFNFSKIFLISAFIALFAVVPMFFVKVPEQLRMATKSFGFRGLSKDFSKFVFVGTVFALANFSYAFMILKTQTLFGGLDYKKALTFTLVLYIFFTVFDSAFSTFIGSLSDKLGRRKIIIFSYVLLALIFAGFSLISFIELERTALFIVLLLLFMLYGLFKSSLDVGQKSFVSDLSGVENRGTALGTFETFTGIAAIPAGLVAGILWNIDQTLPFIYGLILSVVSIILFTFMINKKSA